MTTGCAICGRGPRDHGNIFTRPYGAHTYVPPDTETVKARIKARRSETAG